MTAPSPARSAYLHNLFAALSAQWRDFWRQAARALPKGIWLAGLLLVLLVAALARVTAVFSQPMTHDESYTFIAFASQTLPNVVSDYHLPNNHIFNSVLVHFSTRVFGNGPLAVRLPALLAGLLAVAAVYLLARAQYGDAPALIAAAITAFLEAQVDISILARGYSLLGLLVLLEL
ncbi:MAG: glycosyltransferase family 39 protein, partial [Anaerolineaceae bacterium]